MSIVIRRLLHIGPNTAYLSNAAKAMLPKLVGLESLPISS